MCTIVIEVLTTFSRTSSIKMSEITLAPGSFVVRSIPFLLCCLLIIFLTKAEQCSAPLCLGRQSYKAGRREFEVQRETARTGLLQEKI